MVYPADPGGDKVAKVKHIYVIDTCVVLHDPMALYRFGEHDIYLPLAVIDDLDDIKTRPGNISWSAREVFRIVKIPSISKDFGLFLNISVFLNECIYFVYKKWVYGLVSLYYYLIYSSPGRDSK